MPIDARLASIPGSDRSPLAQALAFGRDPYGFLDGCQAAYGDTFLLRLPGDPTRVVTSNPAWVRQIFGLRPDAYRSDRVAIHINLGGGSLLFLDGERHRQARRVLHPVLHGDQLRAYGPGILQLVDAHIAAWRPGQQLLLHPQMQELTLAVILNSVFGAVDPARRARLRAQTLRWLDDIMSAQMQMLSLLVSANRLRGLLDDLVERLRRAPASPWRRRLRPVPLARALVAKAELTEELLGDLAALRQGGGAGRTDVLARLLGVRYEDGSAPTDEDIVDQLVTLLVGGHETTASTLGWALDALLRHPAALARACAEARAARGPLEEAELPYLSACLRESMRLSPIAPAVGRELTRDLQLEGGPLVPAGTIVWACAYLAQRRADAFPEPAAFRPERFLAGTPSAAQFLPWGGGARRCLGAAFSELEMTLVLARILQRFDLALAEPAPRTRAVFRGITIVPEHRVPIQVRARA